MNVSIFNLHIHSTESDGTYTPEEIVGVAKTAGVFAISITDHDTIAGYFRASPLAEECGIKLIAGVELNTDYSDREIDILGYFWKPDNQSFLDMLKTRQSGRIQRARMIVEKLNTLGLELSFERVREIAQGSICRPHVIEAMIEKKYVADQKEAFEKYLGLGQPAFVPHDQITPIMAIQYVSDAGGLPVIAHPGLIGSDEVVDELLEAGAKGLEAYYPMHSEKEKEKYIQLAQKNKAILTCGSDSHGPKRKKSFPLDSAKAPQEVFLTFNRALEKAYYTQ